MSGAIRGAVRSGLYANRSIVTPTTAQPTMAAITMRTSTSQIEMLGSAGAAEEVKDAKADVRADHEDVAVGEIEELQDPVHHRVPEGDQGVDAAERRGIDERREEPIEIDRGDGHEAEEQGGPDHRPIL